MATLRASYYGGAVSEPAGATAETGITFNRADDQAGTGSPVPIPNAAGTRTSWKKNLALEVTTAGATSITNRTVRHTTAPAAGLKLHFKGAATYAQSSAANAPADDATTNDATPTGYTAMSTTAQSYFATAATAVLGRNGNFCEVVASLSNLYLGGAGTAQAVPSLELSYDEA